MIKIKCKTFEGLGTGTKLLLTTVYVILALACQLKKRNKIILFANATNYTVLQKEYIPLNLQR